MNRIYDDDDDDDDENVKDNSGNLKKWECIELHVIHKGLVNKIFWSCKATILKLHFGMGVFL